MRLPPLPPPPPFLTPDRMARRTVGDRPADRPATPITISEYDPAWPARYRREEARIRTALGVRHLVLRDWLRACPADRDRYAAHKQAAAARHPLSTSGYVRDKGDVIVEILTRAGLR
ncbi:hypothetical protein Aph02nite_46550 [Actinoplanes philippinensis]|uniref:GrpB protein n=1 Tax=Actinoplanes philippinensis TaxID=35752 RepID=A0A1I2I7B1_9ACTN|nr:GrpB family protein [Actinoplanes philippinensis]GIE78705.1 hypothetical protein Aph02nite_46550 [Actinoplanes philippinensis]SFF36421.1 GrpB protein [Actinoplanes philippinensis]